MSMRSLGSERSRHTLRRVSLGRNCPRPSLPAAATVRPARRLGYLDEFTFRFNRRGSRRRGMLFYRLLEQAVLTGPVTYRSLILNPGPTGRLASPAAAITRISSRGAALAQSSLIY